MTTSPMQDSKGPNSEVEVRVVPIRAEDSDQVASFLRTHLNPRVPETAWQGLLAPPWAEAGPNHGFQLMHGSDVVGVYVAVHARRHGNGVEVSVCNLAAFCVLPDFRPHSLRLIRAVTRQKGVVLTDLSPSGAVPAMNERLGFRHLDVATRLVVNLPGSGRGARVTDDPAALESTLQGTDAVVYRDHRAAAAAHHLLVRHGEQYAYLVYRRDRRKRLPLFATPLYVGGEVALLQRAWGAVAVHLLRHGLPCTLAERRILGFTPSGPGRELDRPRPRMVKGEPAPTDHLYSELALLPW